MAAHHLPLTCDRHPTKSFTGFCPSCLRERLRSLESTSATSTTHRNSTSTLSSSLKSIFFNKQASSFSSSSLQPELRRCKSFSCGPRISTSFEPKRISSDVLGHSSLWSLFNRDDNDRTASGEEIEAVRDEIAVVDPVIEREIENEAELRPMKEHIDLELQSKKPTFLLAASVFSKKLQTWRRKQKIKKMKKQDEGNDKPDPKSSRRFCEIQSEIAVDAFGRRSCDLAPRFSLDAGRISFDYPRYSFDEPRASCDGYLLGRFVHPRLAPMLSVVEDVQTPAIQISDCPIPVEKDLTVPGGSQQTKEYYNDTSSRSRRRSLDRSNSVKKLSVEMNEAKPVSIAKVLPAGSTEFFRDWSSNSMEDPHKLPPSKKAKRWSIWGIIHRWGGSRGGDNVVDRSFSESWPEMRSNGKILRSNSNVSSRSSIYGNVGFGSMKKNGLEMNGIGKEKRDEFVLERNRCARFSPGHVDNGMLRFYLAPMRGSGRGLGMNRPSNGNRSFTKSVLGLY